MAALRSCVFYLVYVLFTVVFCTFAPLSFALPFQYRYRILIIWNHFVVRWLKVCCGVKFRVEGLEHLPQGACVIASKHQSNWETYFFQILFQRPLSTILKRELLRVPFFGWSLALMKPIAIDRSSPREALKQILKKGQKRIEAGITVLVFPEGTRVDPGKKGNYARGAAGIAHNGGCPVVPVAHNAGECWPANTFVKYPGTITVRIGAPIEGENMSTKEISAQTEQWIESQMLEITGTARA